MTESIAEWADRIARELATETDEDRERRMREDRYGIYSDLPERDTQARDGSVAECDGAAADEIWRTGT